jgi:hypothetical protein
MRSLHRHLSLRTLVTPAAVALTAGAAFFALPPRAGAADDKPAAKKPAADKADAGDAVTYAKDIQPILQESCVQCHRAPNANAGGPGGPGGGPGGPPGGGPGGRRGPGGGPGGGPRGPAGGLRLDDKAQILRGGKHGKAVVPGKADESLLYKVLKEPVKVGNDEIHAMPKAKPGKDFTPINDDEIALIKKWIDQGAK